MAVSDWPVPRSAYVHIPFCRHHCGYCNFTVTTSRPGLQEAYFNALRLELEQLQSPQHVDTLYLGGGTPSELTEVNLFECLRLCTQWFPIANAGEFTVEINPEDVSPALMTNLKRAGVNRISLGIQSFQDSKLRRLERRHCGAAAMDAVKRACEFIDNVSIDLIFAAPHESLADWLLDLNEVRNVPVKHVSAYGLTYEKGSAFYGRLHRNVLEEICEDDQVEMFCATQEKLTAIGFEQYEISNYAHPGYASRHNQAYWEGAGWFGVGAGAAKFVNGIRAVNDRSTTRYIRRLLNHESPVAESDSLSAEQWALERVAFGLRRLAGVDLTKVERETGVAVQLLLTPLIDRLQEQNLLSLDGPSHSILRIPSNGLLVSDRIIGEILQSDLTSAPRRSSQSYNADLQ